ncbi:MAG: hypothetical protein LWX56_10045 [Ignavibacteria bacterium]|nr:hypothetical protein [Ignavibacteria bacterium]
MWIEIADELINFTRVLKVVKDDASVSIKLYISVDEYLEYTFKSKSEIDIVFFSILESLKSRPVDGILE